MPAPLFSKRICAAGRRATVVDVSSHDVVRRLVYHLTTTMPVRRPLAALAAARQPCRAVRQHRERGEVQREERSGRHGLRSCREDHAEAVRGCRAKPERLLRRSGGWVRRGADGRAGVVQGGGRLARSQQQRHDAQVRTTEATILSQPRVKAMVLSQPRVPKTRPKTARRNIKPKILSQPRIKAMIQSHLRIPKT